MLESRTKYVERFFQTECLVYNRLQEMQGKCIPLCYGKYIIDYDDRELEMDRRVHVLLVQFFEGGRLSEAIPSNFTPDQRREICSKIFDICHRMHESAILWPAVQPDNFLILKGTDVKAFDFAATYKADELKPEERKTEEEVQFRTVRRFLENIGIWRDFENFLGGVELYGALKARSFTYVPNDDSENTYVDCVCNH